MLLELSAKISYQGNSGATTQRVLRADLTFSELAADTADLPATSLLEPPAKRGGKAGILEGLGGLIGSQPFNFTDKPAKPTA